MQKDKEEGKLFVEICGLMTAKQIATEVNEIWPSSMILWNGLLQDITNLRKWHACKEWQ